MYGDMYELYMKSVEERVMETLNPMNKDSNFFISENDIYCNFWPFEKRKIHYCFVVGFSGSGKSTLAKQLAHQYDAEYVELDVIIYDSRHYSMTDRFVVSQQKQRLLMKYIKENNIDFSKMRNLSDSFSPTDTRALIIDMGKSFVEWLTMKNTERCIISGLDLIDILPINPKWYSDPIVFKGTSRLKSIFRRLMRSKNPFNEVKEIPNLLSWYKTDAHGIDYMRNQVIGKYNYQEREEKY